jgi:hypothetical protein
MSDEVTAGGFSHGLFMSLAVLSGEIPESAWGSAAMWRYFFRANVRPRVRLLS